MRALATLLFVLAATAGFAVAGAVLRAATLWFGGTGPAVIVLSLIDYAAPLVFIAGILLALGYAARFAGERRAAVAAAGASADVLPAARDERLGLWMIGAGALLAGLGLAVALARFLAPNPGSGPALAIALRPLLAGAVLAAVGAALRRPPR